MSTTASINSKGTSGTGITEDLAKLLHDNLGKTIVVVAEIRSESRGENLKGDEKVNLAIQNLEVIPDDMGAAEHVREVAKVAHYNRKLAEDGPRLNYDGDDIEPKVADVLAQGAKHRAHPYLASTLSVDDTEHGPVCDVCGLLETAPVHSEQTILDPQLEDGDESNADPYDQVHTKGGVNPGEETACGLHATTEKSLRTHSDHTKVTCDQCLEHLADRDDLEDAETCPHPDCVLVAEHDGDHDLSPVGPDDEPAREAHTLPDPFTP